MGDAEGQAGVTEDVGGLLTLRVETVPSLQKNVWE